MGRRSKYYPLLVLDELLQFAEHAFRSRMRRQHPGLSAGRLNQLVAEWYLQRPGAEDGDAVGRPRPVK